MRGRRAGAEVVVRRIVGWLRHLTWRSVSLAGGAMPSSLSDLPVDEPTPLWRWDLALWRRMADLGVDFGDYGISSPTPAGSTARRPLPTMRYTADEAWWIYRWSRRGGRSDDRCYDLCRALVSAEHWPRAGGGFSWGDHEIARRARYTSGPGSATSWTAWGTSHHLAHVVTWLTARGTPRGELTA